MSCAPINFGDKFTQFSEYWSPRFIDQMNNYPFKLVKIQGEFVWHSQPGPYRDFVSRWLDVRRARCINGHAPIFCTLRGQPLEAGYVRGLFKRLAQKAGIEKRVHPHGLRHTHAA